MSLPHQDSVSRLSSHKRIQSELGTYPEFKTPTKGDYLELPSISRPFRRNDSSSQTIDARASGFASPMFKKLSKTTLDKEKRHASTVQKAKDPTRRGKNKKE